MLFSKFGNIANLDCVVIEQRESLKGQLHRLIKLPFQHGNKKTDHRKPCKMLVTVTTFLLYCMVRHSNSPADFIYTSHN